MYDNHGLERLFMISTDLHEKTANICDLAEIRNIFIETIKHDLKTPVIAQIRILDLLLVGRFGKLNKEQEDIICATLDSCKFMYKVLSDIIYSYKFKNNIPDTVLFAQKLEQKDNKNCLFLIKDFAEKNII